MERVMPIDFIRTSSFSLRGTPCSGASTVRSKKLEKVELESEEELELEELEELEEEEPSEDFSLFTFAFEVSRSWRASSWFAGMEYIRESTMLYPVTRRRSAACHGGKSTAENRCTTGTFPRLSRSLKSISSTICNW